MMLVQALRLYLSEQSLNDVELVRDPGRSAIERGCCSDTREIRRFHGRCRKLSCTSGDVALTFAERFRERTGETPIAYLALANECWPERSSSVVTARWRGSASSLGYESEHAFNALLSNV